MPQAAIPAAIMAAGSIGGALIGGSQQKKAAGQAAATQKDATAAQLALGRDSLALQEQMFNQGLDFNKMQAGVSYDMLSPFVGSGLGANNMLNALLGVTPVDMGANPYNTPQAASPAPGSTPGAVPGAAPGGVPQAGPQPTGAGLANYIQNRF